MVAIQSVPLDVFENVIFPLLDLPSQFSLFLVDKFFVSAFKITKSKLIQHYEETLDSNEHPFAKIVASSIKSKYLELAHFFLDSFPTTFESFSIDSCYNVMNQCLRIGNMNLFRKSAVSLKFRFFSLHRFASLRALGESGDLAFIENVLSMFNLRDVRKMATLDSITHIYQGIVEGGAKAGHSHILNLSFVALQSGDELTLLLSFLEKSLLHGHFENAETVWASSEPSLNQPSTLERFAENLFSAIHPKLGRDIIFGILDFLSKKYKHLSFVFIHLAHESYNEYVFDWLVKNTKFVNSVSDSDNPFDPRQILLSAFERNQLSFLHKVSLLGHNIDFIANVIPQKGSILNYCRSLDTISFFIEKYGVEFEKCVDVRLFFQRYSGAPDDKKTLEYIIRKLTAEKVRESYLGSPKTQRIPTLIDEFILTAVPQIAEDIDANILFNNFYCLRYSGFKWVAKNKPELFSNLDIDILLLNSDVRVLKLDDALLASNDALLASDDALFASSYPIKKRRLSVLNFLFQNPHFLQRFESDASVLRRRLEKIDWGSDGNSLDGLAFLFSKGVPIDRTFFFQTTHKFCNLSSILIETDPSVEISSYSYETNPARLKDPIFRAFNNFDSNTNALVSTMESPFSFSTPIQSVAFDFSQLGFKPQEMPEPSPKESSSKTAKRAKGRKGQSSAVDFDDPFNTH